MSSTFELIITMKRIDKNCNQRHELKAREYKSKNSILLLLKNILMIFAFATLLSVQSAFAINCYVKSAKDSTLSTSTEESLGCLTISSSCSSSEDFCGMNKQVTILVALPKGQTCAQSEAHSAMYDSNHDSRTTCCEEDECNVEEDDEDVGVPIDHDDLMSASATTTTTSTATPVLAVAPKSVVINGTTTVVGSTSTPTPTNASKSLLPGLVAVVVIVSALFV